MTRFSYSPLSPLDGNDVQSEVSEDSGFCHAGENVKSRNEDNLDTLTPSSNAHLVSENGWSFYNNTWDVQSWIFRQLKINPPFFRSLRNLDIPISDLSSLENSHDQSYHNEIPNRFRITDSLVKFPKRIPCCCPSRTTGASFFLQSINKYLFDTLKFRFSVLVTFIHFFLMSLFLKMGFTWFPCFPDVVSVTLNDYLLFILPAGDIACTNKSYQFLPLSAITVIKSSIVVYTYLFSVCFGLEKFRWILFFVLAFTMTSISFAVPGLGTISTVGICIVMLSVIMAALRWVIIHFLLQKRKIAALQLMLLTQPLGSIFLVIVAMLVDYEFFSGSSLEDSDSSSKAAVSYLVVTSVIFAFCLVLAEYQFVGVTSSLTLCVAGIGKESLTILLSIVGFREALTLRNGLAIGFSLVGVLLYSRLRLRFPTLDGNKPPPVLPN
ncbi:putative DP-fucose transporter [Cardiosporidium cionae]|uniref:DP-fucose transporter n=1 Tax=Cardiosporidium cionae TaxID=476202 RepID=A0ABQ7J8H8_9APIC|nr:putative DP-fucose transporter [Cardiosporidium cionae]|eukprot:KAF8820295.1 putative DP-fucose transporter [Cardiosporidium cionae]